jgi:hypothetical protein
MNQDDLLFLLEYLKRAVVALESTATQQKAMAESLDRIDYHMQTLPGDVVMALKGASSSIVPNLTTTVELCPSDRDLVETLVTKLVEKEDGIWLRKQRSEPLNFTGTTQGKS